MEMIQALRSVPILDDLSNEQLEALVPLFSEKLYPKGSAIFWHGDEAGEFYIVKSGLVKYYIPSEDKEIILELLPEGSHFGDVAIFLKDQKRKANTEAVETSVLYTLTKQTLLSFLEVHPDVTVKLLSNMAERYRKAADLIESLTVFDVRRRFYRLLVRLADEYGCTQDGVVTIGLRLTHLQLANMIGTVRETVTKIMTELQDEKLVTIANKQIVLPDLDRLRLACSPELISNSKQPPR